MRVNQEQVAVVPPVDTTLTALLLFVVEMWIDTLGVPTTSSAAYRPARSSANPRRPRSAHGTPRVARLFAAERCRSSVRALSYRAAAVRLPGRYQGLSWVRDSSASSAAPSASEVTRCAPGRTTSATRTAAQRRPAAAAPGGCPGWADLVRRAPRRGRQSNRVTCRLAAAALLPPAR